MNISYATIKGKMRYIMRFLKRKGVLGLRIIDLGIGNDKYMYLIDPYKEEIAWISTSYSRVNLEHITVIPYVTELLDFLEKSVELISDTIDNFELLDGYIYNISVSMVYPDSIHSYSICTSEDTLLRIVESIMVENKYYVYISRKFTRKHFEKAIAMKMML